MTQLLLNAIFTALTLAAVVADVPSNDNACSLNERDGDQLEGHRSLIHRHSVHEFPQQVATEEIVTKGGTKTQRMQFFLAHFAHILRNISWGQPVPGHVDASLQHKFEDIFKKNVWGNPETRSGFGSTVANTATIRACLDSWMTKYKVKFLLDIPCGDGNWQGLIPGIASGAVKYQGYDISPGAVASAKSHNQAHKNMHFGVLDLVNQVPTEQADLIMVKEVIQHLPLAMGLKMLQNAKAAGIKWLAVTSGPSYQNRDIQPGDWFPGPNAQAPPFNFGPEAESCEKADFMLFDMDAWHPANKEEEKKEESSPSWWSSWFGRASAGEEQKEAEKRQRQGF